MGWKVGKLKVDPSWRNASPSTSPLTQSEPTYQIEMTVARSHDYGTWRYVEFSTSRSNDEFRLELPRKWYDEFSTTGTRVIVTITKK